MARRGHILAIDQGTSYTKAVVLNDQGRIVARSGRRSGIVASHPHDGWVEYDPRQILRSVRDAAAAAMQEAGIGAGNLAGIGLANQGETIIAFDSATGDPIVPSISWQDRRSQTVTQRWKAEGLEPLLIERTGLRLDPYFSAPKWAWLLEHSDEARRLHRQGRLRLGTSDSWLIWQLTQEASFITDLATASRTGLLDLETNTWCGELAERMGIDLACLPELRPNAGQFSQLRDDSAGLSSPVVLSGLCVDQQASLYGHGCHHPGQAKATYGTGCFILAQLGPAADRRAEGLLTSIAWKVGPQVSHAFDGGIYAAGAVLDWLLGIGLAKDHAHLLSMMEEGKAADRRGDSGEEVLFIPALYGIASPHWRPDVRARWIGMTHRTRREELIRSAVEAVLFRVREVVDAMAAAGLSFEALRVDGGLSASDVLLQMQADILNGPVHRVAETDSTALGVGWMAGVGAGCWSEADVLQGSPAPAASFSSDFHRAEMYEARYQRWRLAMDEVLR